MLPYDGIFPKAQQLDHLEQFVNLARVETQLRDDEPSLPP